MVLGGLPAAAAGEEEHSRGAEEGGACGFGDGDVVGGGEDVVATAWAPGEGEGLAVDRAKVGQRDVVFEQVRFDVLTSDVVAVAHVKVGVDVVDVAGDGGSAAGVVGFNIVPTL